MTAVPHLLCYFVTNTGVSAESQAALWGVWWKQIGKPHTSQPLTFTPSMALYVFIFSLFWQLSPEVDLFSHTHCTPNVCFNLLHAVFVFVLCICVVICYILPVKHDNENMIIWMPFILSLTHCQSQYHMISAVGSGNITGKRNKLQWTEAVYGLFVCKFHSFA